MIVDHFTRGGIGQEGLDEAIGHAMREYRMSKYDFPNDYIENRLRQNALSALAPQQGATTLTTGPADIMQADETSVDVENLPLIDEQPLKPRSDDDRARKDEYMAKRHALFKQLFDPRLDPASKQAVQKSLRDLKMEYADIEKELAMAESVNKKQGLGQANERTKMREHKNLVKNLRRLLETEVSQAEVMMAAKGFAQELQEMVEKIGRLQNEDLPPVTDQMRETYGLDSAAAFQTQIYGALQSVMDSLYTAKNQVDDAVDNMATTGQVGMSTDMDKPVGGDSIDGISPEAGGDEIGGELDLDNIGDELEADAAGDEFGGAETEEPLGREMKEAAMLKKKIAEMKKLVTKARKLKESNRSK